MEILVRKDPMKSNSIFEFHSKERELDAGANRSLFVMEM